MPSHLTDDQIDRYIRRAASVDEIVDMAEHLDSCPECRDRAAAYVDAEGATSMPKVEATWDPVETRQKSESRPLLWLALLVTVLIVAAGLFLLSYK